MRMKLRRSLSIILIAAVLFVNFSSASTAYASEVDAAGEEQITESIDAADANDAAAIDAAEVTEEASAVDVAAEIDEAGAEVDESSRQSNGHTEKEEAADEVAPAGDGAGEVIPTGDDTGEGAPVEEAPAGDAAGGSAAEEGTPTEEPSAGDTSTESAPEMEIPQVIVEVPEIPDEKSSEKKDAVEDEITFKNFTLVLSKIGDLSDSYPAEFELELWSEAEDGSKISFANLELPSGQTLDENGRVTLPVELTETYVSVGLAVPDNAYYKATLTPASTEDVTCVWSSGESADIGVTGPVSRVSYVQCYAYALYPVKIYKEDQTGEPVVGAQLQILDDQGKIMDSWTSDEEPHVVKLLPTINSNTSEYVLKEESVPEGYIGAADIHFNLYPGSGVVYDKKTYADYTVHMMDIRTGGNLTIEKKFDDNGTKAVLSKNARFGFQVVIKNLPLEYVNCGMDISEAYVKDYGNPSIVEWLNNSSSFWTETKITHIGRYESDYFSSNYFKPASDGKTCYTSFIVWFYSGETFTVYDLPVGAEYEIAEVANSIGNYPPDSHVAQFTIQYSDNKKGTAADEDVTVTVTNVLRTIDLKLSKEVFGYDDGRVFYLIYRAADGILYEAANQTFIDRDGVERSFFRVEREGRTGYTYGLIPFRSEDDEMVIKLPITVHWHIDEYVPKLGVDMSQYSYEDLTAAISAESIFMPPMFAHGTSPENTGYSMLYWPTTSGSNRYKDFVLVYKNASREILFQKTDINGNPISGAHMQILDKETEEVLKEWVSDKDAPYVWNLGRSMDYNTWNPDRVYILRETQTPDGYEAAEDIEFKIGKHIGTTERVDDDGTIMGNIDYYYPYIDTGDGEEIFVLQMKDEYTPRSVLVSKVDVADGAEVENAHIQVLDSSGAVFTEWDSTTEPHLVEGLTVGEEYTLHETVAPEGYLITSDTTFTIAGDGKITTTGKTTTDAEGNTVLLVEDARASVHVSKVDITDESELKDAHIQVIDSAGDIFAEWDSTDEPHVVEGLKVSEVYTLKETVAPDGYTIASEITFTIDENGEVTTRAKTTTDEDGNTVILVEDAKTSVYVSKVDIAGDEELEGAVIQVLDSKGDEVEKWTSTTEPYVIEGLLVGEEYTLKEITAPDGYTITSEITFTVDENNEITTGAKTTTDEDGNTVILIEDAKTYVSVSKTDITGDEELEGAIIQILDSKGGEVEKWTSTTTPHVIEGLLVGEEYTLKEITAPDGYTITAETTFTIDADGKVTTTGSSTTDKDGHPVLLIKDTKTRIEVSKVDITSGEELEGAVIQILDSNGDEVEKWTSTKEPHVVEGLKTGEEYTLKETVAPDGYTIAAETTFTIDENGKVQSETTKISDGVLLVEDAKTHVEVSKVDIADGKEVEGAHIQIIDGEGKVVDEWDSATEPHVIEGLKTGVEYTLRETVAPEGYLVTTDITFTIETTGEVTTRARTTTDEEGHTIILVEDTKTSVSVSKVDIADGEEVEGAHIQILDSDGKVVEEWDSTTEPHTIEGLKTGEEYTLRETVAPEGYSITTDTTFTIDEDGKVTSTGTVTEDGILLVEDAKQNLKVSKVDIADGEEVEGAHIQILDSDGKVVEEWNSTTEPHLIGSLKVGEEYTLRETVAPEGYLVTSDTTFTIDKEGKVTTTGSSTTDEEGNTILLVEDGKTHIEVSKVDIVDGAELEGAHIQIIDSDGNVVEEWDSTTEPHVIEGLKTGEEYTLRETVAPEGYLVTTDTTFTIDENGKVTSTGSTTTDQDGHTILLVEDAREGETAITIGGKKVLEGGTLKAGQFTFVLTDEDGKSIGEAKNDAEGNFSFGKLAYRTSDLRGEKSKVFTYKISETKGSDSTITYDETVITVKVTVTDEGDGKLTAEADKAASEIKFVNKVKEKKIDNNTNRPSSSAGGKKGSRTGDEAPLGILFGGLGIGAAGLIALLAVRRRRKAGE